MALFDSGFIIPTVLKNNNAVSGQVKPIRCFNNLHAGASANFFFQNKFKKKFFQEHIIGVSNFFEFCLS